MEFEGQRLVGGSGGLCYLFKIFDFFCLKLA